MQVILNKDVTKLGKAGDIVKVKDGFGRNFLIPKGMAVISNPENLKKIEQYKKMKSSQLEKKLKEAKELKAKIEALSITIPVLTQEGAEDKLYGSITAQEIQDALKAEGIELVKSAICLDEPVKAVGIYEIDIKLHPEVLSKAKVWVVKK